MGSEPKEKLWVGAEMPSLQARRQDVFERDIPGYDLRRLILARDPLAASLAFAVQIRLVLATILGFRMCPECPHCAETSNPCMDAFGSCAEAMGGIAGRCDGIAGAVECQNKRYFALPLLVLRATAAPIRVSGRNRQATRGRTRDSC